MNQKIGLKTCWHKKQIATRLPHNPAILEIYLYDGDLENHLGEIEEGIKEMKKSGAEITIHQPEFFNGKTFTIASSNKNLTKNALGGYELLVGLCKKHKLKGLILHPYSANLDKPEINKSYKTINRESFMRNINKNKDLKKYAYLENIPIGFFSREEDIAEIRRKTKTRLCMDLCHLYMAYQDNNKMEKVLKNLVKTEDYFHIVDTRGNNHDSLEIGKGEINFEKIIKYIRQGIIEVNCKNQITADEMIRSYYEFNKRKKRRKKHAWLIRLSKISRYLSRKRMREIVTPLFFKV